MARPKDIGTAGETAVVRYLNANGFPHAERRALAGAYDLGDITGTPGVAWEVKAGQAAKTAGDKQVTDWLVETETERVNARADVGVLVMARAGYGAARAGQWWAVVPGWAFVYIGGWQIPGVDFFPTSYRRHLSDVGPVRLWLTDLVYLLRAAGYGDPITKD